MKTWLIVWGILAFLALQAPGLVAAGLFLILPGFILLAAPTVALYSLTFAAIRLYLPLPPGLILNATAAALALALGWAAAQPVAIEGRRAFDHANLPDVLPAEPVELDGHIRLELPQPAGRAKRAKGEAETCQALCAALLATPGVETVALATTGQSTITPVPIFRLVSRAADRSSGLYPVKPEAILADLPPDTDAEAAPRFQQRAAVKKADAQAVAAAWALRLASRQKLTVETAPMPAAITVRVTREYAGKERRISLSRVEILDARQRSLMRRSIVAGSALAAPLHFTGVGGLQNFRVELAHVRLSSGPEYPELKPVTELFRHSTLARPKPNPRATADLLERLRAATDNPALAPGDPDLGLAALWLPTIDWSGPLPARQSEVLGRVIADARIPLPLHLYDGYDSKVSPDLRGPLVSRIRNAATPGPLRNRLARILSRMPAGTFATLSGDEDTILSNPELRADAYPLIVRMADSGPAAVPSLLDIVRNGETIPRESRRFVLRSVALALALLGPRASGALPEVDALFQANRSRLFGSWSEVRIWYLALARLGKPIDDFEWFTTKPESIAQSRQNLRRQVARFQAEKVWDY